MCTMAVLFVLTRKQLSTGRAIQKTVLDLFSWVRGCKLTARHWADFTGVISFHINTQETVKKRAVLKISGYSLVCTPSVLIILSHVVENF